MCWKERERGNEREKLTRLLVLIPHLSARGRCRRSIRLLPVGSAPSIYQLCDGAAAGVLDGGPEAAGGAPSGRDLHTDQLPLSVAALTFPAAANGVVAESREKTAGNSVDFREGGGGGERTTPTEEGSRGGRTDGRLTGRSCAHRGLWYGRTGVIE